MSSRLPDNTPPVTVIAVYLARRGLRLTTFGELMLPTLGLMVMVGVAWALICVIA